MFNETARAVSAIGRKIRRAKGMELTRLRRDLMRALDHMHQALSRKCK